MDVVRNVWGDGFWEFWKSEIKIFYIFRILSKSWVRNIGFCVKTSISNFPFLWPDLTWPPLEGRLGDVIGLNGHHYRYLQCDSERMSFLNMLWRVKNSETCMCVNRIYVLKANAGKFVKIPCLRAGFAFLGMHARLNFWHYFDHFLHFIVIHLVWRQNKFGGEQS